MPMEKEIILERKHFPKELTQAAIASAYASIPCIMDKALHEQYDEEVHNGAHGIVLSNRTGKVIGRIANWDHIEAFKMALALKEDDKLKFPFTLKLE